MIHVSRPLHSAVFCLILALALPLTARLRAAASDIPGNTLSTVRADGYKRQELYLWEEGNMPSSISYTENDGTYPEGPEFRPYLVTFPVPEGIPVKGALIINAGGAFSSRIDWIEGTPVAQEFSKRGYQCFVLSYRLIPYSESDAAADLARAVRFVRKNAAVYRIDPEDIASMGFSAGGMLIGEMLMSFDGTVNGTALGGSYTPDSLDGESADLAAAAFLYSYIGTMEGPETNLERLRNADFPPLYYCFGTGDLYLSRFEASLAALSDAGIPVNTDILKGQPHSFGLNGGWTDRFDSWLTAVFSGEEGYEKEYPEQALRSAGREQKLVPLSDGTYALLKGQWCATGPGWYSGNSDVLDLTNGILTAKTRGSALLQSTGRSLEVRVLSPIPDTRILKLRVGETAAPSLRDRGTGKTLQELGARVRWTIRDTRVARMIDDRLVAVVPGVTWVNGEFCGRRFRFVLHVLKPFEKGSSVHRHREYTGP